VSTGTLHVCAVPIGNLADASPRLREVLAAVGAIACEDTRTTGKLLELLGVEPRPRLLAHHGHNERASASGVVELLLGGTDVAVVSDAGTPAVSDPGVELARAAHEAGVPVRAVAGPSALAAALSVSGAGGGDVRFVGFLPRAAGDLERVLEVGAGDVLVAFEAPRRLRDTLAVVDRLQPQRVLTVCRELTKLHEQVERGTAAQVLARLDGEVRGEVVLVLDPVAASGEGEPVPAAALALARDLVGAGLRQREAARIATSHLGGSARSAYDLLSGSHG
jgi:16S rRNA (cytidine1402-2'-O)-methyltransferase